MFYYISSSYIVIVIIICPTSFPCFFLFIIPLNTFIVPCWFNHCWLIIFFSFVDLNNSSLRLPTTLAQQYRVEIYWLIESHDSQVPFFLLLAGWIVKCRWRQRTWRFNDEIMTAFLIIIRAGQIGLVTLYTRPTVRHVHISDAIKCWSRFLLFWTIAESLLCEWFLSSLSEIFLISHVTWLT